MRRSRRAARLVRIATPRSAVRARNEVELRPHDDHDADRHDEGLEGFGPPGFFRVSHQAEDIEPQPIDAEEQQETQMWHRFTPSETSAALVQTAYAEYSSARLGYCPAHAKPTEARGAIRIVLNLQRFRGKNAARALSIQPGKGRVMQVSFYTFA